MSVTRYTCRRFPLIKESESGEYVEFHDYQKLVDDQESLHNQWGDYCNNLENLKNEKIQELIEEKKALSEWWKDEIALNKKYNRQIKKIFGAIVIQWLALIMLIIYLMATQ